MGIKETFVSVDTEASGPIPGEYSMLSLGACLVFDISKTFYIEFKPINDNYVRGAIEVTGLSLEKLKKTGVEPKVGMYEFDNWTKDVSGESRPVFVSFGTWDWMFVSYYFYKFLNHNPYGFNSLDIKSLYMGKLSLKNWAETSKKRFDPRFLSERKHTHNALDDAIEQAEIFRKIFEYK
jgi:DNA polymerase III epsilon subunit-like protein